MPANRSENIAAFFAAVFANAWAYVMYGTGASILAIWGYVKSQPPPRWLWLTVATLAFFVASYKAWREERTQLNKFSSELDSIKSTVPRLEGDINTWQVLPPASPDVKHGTLFIYAAIINRGAPTVVDQWQVFIGGKLFSPESEVMVDPYGKRGNLARSTGLLQPGNKLVGWVACRLTQPFVDEKYRLPKLELRFCDYLKNEYSASWEQAPDDLPTPRA